MTKSTTAKSLPPTADIREALALLNSGEWSEAEFTAWDASRKSAEKSRNLTLKTSYNGALSLYGMGQFPVTLYAEQWLALLGHREQIEAHIAADKPQHHPAFKDKKGVQHVARTVRLKRKTDTENAFIVESEGTQG